jgi:hypothetical protein
VFSWAFLAFGDWLFMDQNFSHLAFLLKWVPLLMQVPVVPFWVATLGLTIWDPHIWFNQCAKPKLLFCQYEHSLSPKYSKFFLI